MPVIGSMINKKGSKMKEFIIYPVCIYCTNNIKGLKCGKAPNWMHFTCYLKYHFKKLFNKFFEDKD